MGIGPRLRVMIKERVNSAVVTRREEAPGTQREAVPSGTTIK